MRWLILCRHFALSILYCLIFPLAICWGQGQGQSGSKWPPYVVPPPSSTSLQRGGERLIPETQTKPSGAIHSIQRQVPQIHSPQTNLTGTVGDTVQLPCKVFNLGEWQVLWKHGTNILAGSNITKFEDRINLYNTNESDFTLTISKVSRDDDGRYECIVSSPSWTPIRLAHSLIVHDAPTVRLLTPTNVVLKEGESKEIGCIPQGHPLPRIVWTMRDGIVPLALHNHLNRSTLPLNNVTRHYTGLYVCTADNGVGRPAIGAVYVRVLFVPEIETVNRRAHSGPGFRALLVGLVHADPKPEVRWKKGETTVSNTDTVYTEVFGKNEYRLIFTSVKASDFDVYTLEANNTLGFAAKKIEFVGVPNVPVLNRWETEDVNGIQVTLYWSVECYSSLVEYRLYFRASTIPQNSETENTVDFDQEKDPDLIKLTIPADTFSNVATSFLHTKSFTLRGLNQSTIYQGAVQARNKFGWSLVSNVCYFATFPNTSSKKPIEETVKDLHLRYRELGGIPGQQHRLNTKKVSSATNSSTPKNSAISLTCALFLLLFLLHRNV